MKKYVKIKLLYTEYILTYLEGYRNRLYTL